MKKKILITLALIFILMPSICNASSTLTLYSVTLGDNDKWYREYTGSDLSSFNIGQVSVRGKLYAQSTARVWPYNKVKFIYTSTVSGRYNTQFMLNTSFVKDETSLFLSFNNKTCNLVSKINQISYWDCDSVLVKEGNNNIINIKFVNDNSSSSSWSYGLSAIFVDETTSTNTQTILEFMKIYNNEIKALIESKNNAIIDNANKNHQEQIENENKNHQDTMNTITSSDVSASSESANGFFNSFENNDHGLSGIVTAPLRLIQALTSRAQYQIPITMLGKTVYLPPFDSWLDSFDNNTKNAIKTFRLSFNTIVGGLVCYGAVKGIFKKVEELKNPDDSRVEVMDL